MLQAAGSKRSSKMREPMMSDGAVGMVKLILKLSDDGIVNLDRRKAAMVS